MDSLAIALAYNGTNSCKNEGYPKQLKECGSELEDDDPKNDRHCGNPAIKNLEGLSRRYLCMILHVEKQKMLVGSCAKSPAYILRESIVRDVLQGTEYCRA